MTANIGLLSYDERVWALPAFRRALPALRAAGYRVVKLWACPQRFAGLRGSAVPRWYLRTFGPHDFLKLACLAGASAAKRRGDDFARLAADAGVPYGFVHKPNGPEFADEVRRLTVDVLVVGVGHIIRGPLLSAPRVGIINKHASLLPAHGGVFPYLWAQTAGDRQGVSFHVVTEGVDEGPIVYQETLSPARSMAAFYRSVYADYHRGLVAAVANLLAGRYVAPDPALVPSYHSLPTRAALSRFRAAGGRVVTWPDVISPL